MRGFTRWFPEIPKIHEKLEKRFLRKRCAGLCPGEASGQKPRCRRLNAKETLWSLFHQIPVLLRAEEKCFPSQSKIRMFKRISAGCKKSFPDLHMSGHMQTGFNCLPPDSSPPCGWCGFLPWNAGVPVFSGERKHRPLRCCPPLRTHIPRSSPAGTPWR